MSYLTERLGPGREITKNSIKRQEVFLADYLRRKQAEALQKALRSYK